MRNMQSVSTFILKGSELKGLVTSKAYFLLFSFLKSSLKVLERVFKMGESYGSLQGCFRLIFTLTRNLYSKSTSFLRFFSDVYSDSLVLGLMETLHFA